MPAVAVPELTHVAGEAVFAQATPSASGVYPTVLTAGWQVSQALSGLTALGATKPGTPQPGTQAAAPLQTFPGAQVDPTGTAEQLKLQTPAVQTFPVGQTLPHVPQLFGSVLRSVQPLLGQQLDTQAIGV